MQSSVAITQVAVGPMANFSYLMADTNAKKALYVDPGWEPEKVIAAAKLNGWEIVGIVVTHFHYDHCKALPEAWELLKVPVYLPKGEGESIDESQYQTIWMEEGTTIPVGSQTVQCLSMPGHTPNEICLSAGSHLLTGDVLFVDGCGRVDLPGSDPEKMFVTLQRIAQMPDATVIYPGHDYGPSPTDTLGHQKKTNPYLTAALRGQKEFFGVRGV